MPVQYASQSVLASHHFTREHASLFDVSHMVQHMFRGKLATEFLERITPASLKTLPENHSTLTTLLWPGTGGIVDDAIITKLPQEKHNGNQYYVVTNAACRNKDLKYIKEQLAEFKAENNGKHKDLGGHADRLNHQVMDDRGLLALQGPLAEEILTKILSDTAKAEVGKLFFGQHCFIPYQVGNMEGIRYMDVSRGGYTGEDGFEISIKAEDTVAVTEALLEAGGDKLKLAGLGARDSLRLEAGMCLYGHDLDDTTTPVEAALSWVIGKDRRDMDAPNKFHGAEVILPQLTPKSKGGKGVVRRRVGLVVEGAPAREGCEIADSEGQKIGVVTSGCPSPSLGKNIAMGYIKDGMHKAGTKVQVVVRGKPRKATVAKMPFVPTKYHKEPAPASA